MKKHLFDSSFKKLFQRNEFIRSLLENFVGEEWCAQIDFDKIQFENTELKSIKDSDKSVDMLVHLQSISGDVTFYLFLLIEFQSTPKPMHLRLIEYKHRIWKRNEEQGRPFEPIIPIVIYNGAEKWKESPVTEKLFQGVDATLLRYGQNDYILVDFSQIPTKELYEIATGLSALIELEKIRHKTDMVDLYEDISKLISRVIFQTIDNFEDLKHYMLKIFEREKFPPELKLLLENPENKEVAMGFQETLRAYREQFIEEGHAEGRIEERRDNAKAMKNEGLDFKLIAKITGLAIEEIELL